MVEKEGLEESISGTEKRKVYLRERIERGVIAICVFPEKKTKRARSLPQLTCATWNLIVFNNQDGGGLFLSKNYADQNKLKNAQD